MKLCSPSWQQRSSKNSDNHRDIINILFVERASDAYDIFRCDIGVDHSGLQILMTKQLVDMYNLSLYNACNNRISIKINVMFH